MNWEKLDYETYKELIMDNVKTIKQDTCVVCGRKSNNQHHIIQKGMGGVGRKGKESATVSLCGMGNASGCHGKAHSHTLHFRYSFSGGLEYLKTDKSMNILDALLLQGWKPVKED